MPGWVHVLSCVELAASYWGAARIPAELPWLGSLPCSQADKFASGSGEGCWEEETQTSGICRVFKVKSHAWPWNP